MATGKHKEGSRGEEGQEVSWQAQKSAMTRDRILDAAINCFIELGYTNMTTAKVASAAGVSRGAMLHHFPSKTELIQAAVKSLHHKLLEDYTERVKRISPKLNGAGFRRARIDAYWQHLSGDLFTAYHEICVAGRTDRELKNILEKSSARFDQHVLESNAELFEDWEGTGDHVLLAMDLTRFMMEGMAVGQLVVNREERVNRLLDYLADRLEEIFQNGSSGATGRYSS